MYEQIKYTRKKNIQEEEIRRKRRTKNMNKKLFKSLKYNDYVIRNVYADHYCMSHTTLNSIN